MFLTNKIDMAFPGIMPYPNKAAVKQSIKAYIPKLNPLTSLEDIIYKDKTGFDCYIAHCHEGKKEDLFKSAKPHSKYMLFVGPEGDFSREEVGHAVTNAIMPVSLGSSRLRTETAGVAAVHTISLLNI